MKTQKKPRDILKDILEQYGVEDNVLHKFMLRVDLSTGYQYLEDGSLNETYVEECIQKAVEVFKFMEYSDNLLIVYEDLYGEENEVNKRFLESTLVGIIQSDTYRLKWQYPDDATIYTCNRQLYHVKEVNIRDGYIAFWNEWHRRRGI